MKIGGRARQWSESSAVRLRKKDLSVVRCKASANNFLHFLIWRMPDERSNARKWRTKTFMSRKQMHRAHYVHNVDLIRTLSGRFGWFHTTNEWYDDHLVSKSLHWHTSNVLETKQNKNYSTQLCWAQNWTSFCYHVECACFNGMHTSACAMMIFRLLFHFWIFSLVIHRNLKGSCNRYDALDRWTNKYYTKWMLQKSFFEIVLEIRIWLKAGRAASYTI